MILTSRPGDPYPFQGGREIRFRECLQGLAQQKMDATARRMSGEKSQRLSPSRPQLPGLGDDGVLRAGYGMRKAGQYSVTPSGRLDAAAVTVFAGTTGWGGRFFF